MNSEKTNSMPMGDASGNGLGGASASPDVSRVLDIAMKAGTILLENGAEISRVEETMSRIAAHYGVVHDNFFVLANGIFTTGWDPDNKWPGSFAKVKHIPIRSTRFDRIIAVNQLSREISIGKYDLDEAEKRLEEIRNMAGKPVWVQLIAAFFACGAFSVLFGGSLYDALVSAIAGLIVWLFVIYVYDPHLSKITGNIFGAALGTLICVVLSRIGLGDTLGQMIIGAMIPLIPGVAFTNGVRDIADADYISGVVRLLDAILGFLCIAVGVAIVYVVYRYVFGGMPS